MKKRQIWALALSLALCASLLPAARAAEPVYDTIRDYQEGYAPVSQGEKWGLLDETGKVCIPLVYERMGPASQGVCLAVKNGKYGYLNAADGSAITGFIYDYALDFWNVGKVARLVDGRNYFGAVNRTGKLVVPMEYGHIYLSPNGDAYITQNTDWAAGMREYYGAYDLEGNLLYPCEFTSEERLLAAIANGGDDPSLAGESSQAAGVSVTWYPDCEAITRCYGTDRMVLTKQGKAGIFGLDGTAYTDCVYDVLEYNAEETVFLAARNGKWGRLDRNGAVITDFLYGTKNEAAQEAKAQMVQEPGGWKYAVAAMDGALLTDYIYWAAGKFAYGYAAVYQDGSDKGWGYVDETGKEVIPCRYWSGGVEDFGPDGFAIVYSHDRGYNVVDTTGREIFPQDGYIRKVWRAGKGLWGRNGENGVEFWNDDGELVRSGGFGTYTDPKGFTFGNVFDENGVAAVYSNSRVPDYYVNINGERVEPPVQEEYVDEDLLFREGLRWVNREGKHDAFWPMEKGWGFENEAGELVVPYLYDAVGYFDHGYASVRLNGVYGMLKNPLLEDEDAHEVSDWAVAEVTAATEAGYVTPRCSTYQTRTITRLQFAELAVNYLEKKTGQSITPALADTFTDTSDETVLKASAAGIVQGVGEGRFDPGGLLTREQLATMLWRAMEKVGAGMHYGSLNQYTDADQISDWAAMAMNNLVHHEVMTGTSETTLSPKASCTVEQAILLIWRAAGKEYTLPSEQEAWRQAAIDRVTIEDLRIGMPFDQLPQELRAALQFQGETDDFAPIPDKEICKRYTAPGIEIVTSTVLDQVAQKWFRENATDEELLELFGTTDRQTALAQVLGREYVECVILTGDAYPMASGLKVGDSEERVKELGYSLNGEGRYSEVMYSLGSTYMDLESGKVIRIKVYDSIGRRVGPFFDP